MILEVFLLCASLETSRPRRGEDKGWTEHNLAGFPHFQDQQSTDGRAAVVSGGRFVGR